MTTKSIYAKYDSTCWRCGKEILKGALISWNPDATRGRKATHPECSLKQPAKPTTPDPVEDEIIAEESTTEKVKDLTYDASKSIFRTFDNVTDFTALKPSAANLGHFNAYATEGPRWWGGGAADRHQCERLINTGWDAGAKRLDDLTEGYIATRSATDIKRRLIQDDHGDEIDIHKVYGGDLDHAWSRKSRKQRFAPPVITLVAPIGGNCSKTPEELFWRGAAVAKLCDLLSTAGYNVEIIASCCAYGLVGSGDKRSLYGDIVQIKESSQPLDLAGVASTICYPGFMRFAMFKAMASAPFRMGSHYGTYGDDTYQQKVAAAVIKHFRPDTQPVMVDVAIYDKDSADRWIETAIDSINSNTLHEEQAA